MKHILRSASVMLVTFILTCQLSGQVLINEYSCSNLTQFADNFGKYEDWFELYNAGTTSVSLSGYYLSDDSLEVQKWAFPAGTSIAANGFIRIWASGRDLVVSNHFHTSFKLTQTKNDPEFIILADPNGVILDYVKLTKKTHLGHSRGRTLNGAPAWSIFTTPTPNASNNTSVPYSNYAEKPNVNIPAGFYSSAQLIYLSTTEPNCSIHYTLDGNAPTISSATYTSPINIPTTKVLKAMTFSGNNEVLPSLEEFNTYFINVSHTLPVISISGTQLPNLANGSGNLEPKGSFEYFNINHERKAQTFGEYNKHGQDSWGNSHRSIDFVSRDEMAYNHSIEEMMFHWTDRKNFQRIILRAAGDDNYPADHHSANEGSAHMRDAYIHSLADIGGLHLDVRRSEKCIIYLNGQYWGVYDIRERADDHDYCDYYYGQDKYHLYYILLWGSTWAEYGGATAMTAWDNFYSWIMSHNMADQADFDYVTERFDFASLVDYVIVNSFTVCSDWLNWNVGWWRGIDSTGGHLKWGYILWDNDATFGHYINYTGIPNTTPTADPCNPEQLSGSSDPEGHIVLLNHLRQNEGFENYYKTRQIDLWNTVFNCENMISQLDSTEAIIDPEMEGQAQRWNGTYAEWKDNVSQLRDFINQRCVYLSNGFINCYSLTGPYNLVIKTDPPGAGKVMLNSLALDSLPWSGTYFGNIETRLKAYPNWDYSFSHWSSGSQTFLPAAGSDTASVFLSSSDTIIAHFTYNTGIAPITAPQGIQARLYPSLVNTYTRLEFNLGEPAEVNISVLNSLGQTLANINPSATSYPAGTHTVMVDMAHYDLAPGMYFVELRAGTTHRTFKLIYSPQ